MSNGLPVGLETNFRDCLAVLVQIIIPLPEKDQFQYARDYLLKHATCFSQDQLRDLVICVNDQFPGFQDYWKLREEQILLFDSQKDSFDSTATVIVPDTQNPTPLVSLRGSNVGRYRFEVLLGKGGFGEVWKGYDSELNRPVAIKLERRDRKGDVTTREKFLEKLKGLRHCLIEESSRFMTLHGGMKAM